MATNAASNAAQSAMGDIPTATSSEYKTHPTETMRALQWHGKRDVRMATVPRPVVTNPQDVVLKVTGTTVCGSDLHLYTGDIIQLKSGDIIGHEPMGIIAEVGPDVKNFKVGDKDQYSCCEVTNNSSVQKELYGDTISGIIGYGHYLGGYAGGQAEYVRIPFGDVSLIKVPATLPDEKALYVSDIACTSLHSIRSIDIVKGETVGVWGLGPIGLLVCQWLHLIGVKRIIAIDEVPSRLELVRTKYAAETIDFSQYNDVSKRVRELVPEGLDAAIDAAAFRFAKSIPHKIMRATGLETDSPEIVNEAIRSVGKLGRIALIADYSAYANGFLLGAVMEKGIMLKGCGQCPAQKYMSEVMGLIADGTFDPDVILTHRFTLEDLPQVYAAFEEKRDGMMKVFIETKFSAPAAPGTPTLSTVPKA